MNPLWICAGAAALAVASALVAPRALRRLEREARLPVPPLPGFAAQPPH